MRGKRILLIVGGGIAAYKACELVRLIRKAGGAVTCVLTETSNPKHMEENAQAAFGPMPDEAARRRMREFIATV